MVQVSISVQVRRPGITASTLRQVLRHVVRRQPGRRAPHLGVALVSDRVIRALNRVYLRHDHPTDVLAFPSSDGTHPRSERARRYLGDVVISVDRARVQARAAGHPLRTEIALLAVHGTLHLFGYEDHRRREASRMARRQRMLLAEMGIKVAG